MASPAEQLKKTLLRQLEKKKEIISNQVAKPTEPIIPNKLEAGKFSFDELSEIELARQMSLLESRIYSSIETSEVCQREGLALPLTNASNDTMSLILSLSLFLFLVFSS